MGILLSFLPFFDSCHRQGALQSPLLALGSLEIHEPEEHIISFATKNSYYNLHKEKSVRSLLLDRYGVDQYKDLDINNRADILLDLNLPITKNFEGVASTILNSGTLEHVFDIRQAFINIHLMAREEGAIIHVSPLTWHNHAFFNFNPKLFHGLINANDYELLVEAFLIPQTRKLFNRHQGRQLYLTYAEHENPEARKAIEDQLSQKSLPANSLYMIAYKKKKNSFFRNPYDM